MIATREFNASKIAFDLGAAAVDQAIDRLERIRDLERAARQDVNAAEITSLSAELALRTEQRNELRDEISRTPRPDPSGRQSRIWYVAIALVLAMAGFAFAHLALTPFGVGWEVWPIAIALSVVCAYATDETLEKCACERLVTAAGLASFVTSVTGLLIMALVRGDILVLFLKNAMASGTGDTVSPSVGGDAVQFYANAAWKLRLFFALLAVSMELATGLAIYGARKVPILSNVLAALQEQFRLLEAEMIRLVHRIEYLKRDPEIFANEFSRDFYLGLIKCAARRSSKYVGPILVLVLQLGSGFLDRTLVAQPLDAAVGLDLSLTSASKNYDGRLEHDKNIESVARLIRTLPAAARVRVLGITNQSFTRPLMMLDGRIPKDRGPLGLLDQITIARNNYAEQMRQIGRATPPTYRETDVIGFLLIAADLLREHPQGRKVLVIFSDMRHSAPAPNIETPRVVPVALALRTVERQNQIADLKGVEVYVYGAHAADKDVAYWQSLRSFWTQYFAKSGAALKDFSMMRDVVELDSIRW